MRREQPELEAFRASAMRASGDEKLANGGHIPEAFMNYPRFLVHFPMVSNIRTCRHRLLGSKVGSGIGAVFAVLELTPVIRILAVISDCGGRAEEGLSWEDGLTGVKSLSPRSLPNHRNRYHPSHSQSARCPREIARREELNRSATRP